MTNPINHTGQNRGERDYRIVALTVSASLFMQYLDSTALNTALPSMARQFGVSPSAMSVVVTAFLLSMALFIPAGAPLAERFGARRTYQAAILLFMLGSLASACAPTLSALVVGRLIQGLGGAIMMPVGRAVVVRSAPKADLISAMNWLIIPGIIGPILGPPLGGFLTSFLSWRWVFYVNLPVGTLGLLLSALYLPAVKTPPNGPFDLLGLILCGIALATGVFGLNALSSGSPSAIWLALWASCAVASSLYLRHARRTASPVIDLSLLNIATFRVSLVAGNCVRAAGAACSFLMPQLFQTVFSMTPAKSGMIVFLSVGGALLSRSASRHLINRFSVRDFTVVGCAATAALIVCYSAMTAEWSPWSLSALLLACGFCQSLPLLVLSALAFADVPPPRMTAATGFTTTVQQLALSVGVSLSVLSLNTATRLHHHEVPLQSDFAMTFVAIACVTFMGGLAVFGLDRDAGASIRKSPARP